MPEDTSQRDPLIHVAEMLGGGSSRYIEEMERDGQRQLVDSTDLPSESERTDDSVYEALGFTFGQPHAHDPLFRPATLPEGWKREGSDHAMWSYIVDDKGRRRVSIFYKAAFYDRKASMGIVHPTNVLGEIEFADQEPTSLPIDDLLTAEDARAWIDGERERIREHRDRYMEQGTQEYGQYTAKLARLDAMAALLPQEGPQR